MIHTLHVQHGRTLIYTALVLSTPAILKMSVMIMGLATPHTLQSHTCYVTHATLSLVPPTHPCLFSPPMVARVLMYGSPVDQALGPEVPSSAREVTVPRSYPRRSWPLTSSRLHPQDADNVEFQQVHTAAVADRHSAGFAAGNGAGLWA